MEVLTVRGAIGRLADLQGKVIDQRLVLPFVNPGHTHFSDGGGIEEQPFPVQSKLRSLFRKPGTLNERHAGVRDIFVNYLYGENMEAKCFPGIYQEDPPKISAFFYLRNAAPEKIIELFPMVDFCINFEVLGDILWAVKRRDPANFQMARPSLDIEATRIEGSEYLSEINIGFPKENPRTPEGIADYIRQGIPDEYSWAFEELGITDRLDGLIFPERSQIILSTVMSAVQMRVGDANYSSF